MNEGATASQDVIGELCAAVLGKDRVDPNEDFFLIGGNSLLAVRLTNRIAATTGVEVPAARFYQGSSVVELARTVDALLAGGQ
jgi:acyl carrier protein